MNGAEVTGPLAIGYGTASDSKIGVPVQVASLGPYSRKSTVAESCGFTRPETVTLSVSCPGPSGIEGDAVVAIVGWARLTVMPSLVPRADAVRDWAVCCVLSVICTVWMPGRPGWPAGKSTVGTRTTSNVKSIRHSAPSPVSVTC